MDTQSMRALDLESLPATAESEDVFSAIVAIKKYLMPREVSRSTNCTNRGGAYEDRVSAIDTLNELVTEASHKKMMMKLIQTATSSILEDIRLASWQAERIREERRMYEDLPDMYRRMTEDVRRDITVQTRKQAKLHSKLMEQAALDDKLSLLEEVGKNRIFDNAGSKFNIGDIALVPGKGGEALQRDLTRSLNQGSFGICLAICQKMINEKLVQKTEVSKIYKIMGDMYKRMWQPDNAVKMWQACIDVESKDKHLPPNELCRVRGNIADVYIRRGICEEARQLYEINIAHYESNKQSNSIECAKQQNNLAMTYYQSEDLEKALQMTKTVIEKLKRCESENVEPAQKTCIRGMTMKAENNVACCYIKLQMCEHAHTQLCEMFETYYKRAYKVESVSNETLPKVVIEMEKACGDTYDPKHLEQFKIFSSVNRLPERYEEDSLMHSINVLIKLYRTTQQNIGIQVVEEFKSRYEQKKSIDRECRSRSTRNSMALNQ